MLKAIYSHDIATKDVPIFTYNKESGLFECGELNYSFYIVMNDTDWLVFVTNGETVYPIENKNRATEDEIISLLDL